MIRQGEGGWLIAGLALALTLSPPSLAAQGVAEAEGQFNMGVTHLREGRVDLAIDAFREAIKRDPKNPYFRKGLGQAYAAKTKFKDAVAEFRKALELNPYYVDVRNDLGAALILMGKREEGRKEFLAAFGDATNPTPEVSARNLGQSYIDEKNYGQALNWFQTSLARNPKYVDANLGVAECLTALGRAQEALARLESAAKALPDEPAVLLAVGEAYYRAGRFTEGRAQLEQAVKRDPGGISGRRAADLLKSFPK
jgi:Tfp pilus assembly protein PilF